MACALLIRRMKTHHIPSRNLCHAKFSVKNISKYFKIYEDVIGYFICSHYPHIPYHLVNIINESSSRVVADEGHTDICHFQGCHFPFEFPVDKVGASSPSVNNSCYH